jgi:hypothetical protein
MKDNLGSEAFAIGILNFKVDGKFVIVLNIGGAGFIFGGCGAGSCHAAEYAALAGNHCLSLIYCRFTRCAG